MIGSMSSRSEPGGVVVRGAPFVAHGEARRDRDRARRSQLPVQRRGRVAQDDGDDYRVGLALIGMPVCLHSVGSAVTRRIWSTASKLRPDFSTGSVS